MMDVRPRWTIQKNPNRFPTSRELPWVVYETAAMLHFMPVMERFRTYSEARSWAFQNAPEGYEVVLFKILKRPAATKR